jgi:cell division protein FtsB
MSTSQDTLRAQAAALRKKLGDAEAVADQLRAKLAVVEAKLTGGPVPLSGLEILWQSALPKSRERSSKHRCRTAWNRIPQAERPRVEVMLAALKAWCRCDAWKAEGGLYAPGLHRFIAERMWEDLPEVEKARSRYPSVGITPTVRKTTEEGVTDLAEIAALLNIRPLRVNS